MATYAVFEPPLKEQSAAHADVLAHAERFKFVRDGFSWLAFLFTPFWMLFNRLWLAFVGYLVLMAVIGVGATLLGLAPGAVTLASLVLALAVGFEAGTLRRRKLLWKRWQDLGVVTARDRETAERRFFDRWIALKPVQTAPLVAAELAATSEAAHKPAYDSDSYVSDRPVANPSTGSNP